ncbi:hypothetical protein ACJ8PQ_13625, partial [Serratia sp. CY74664]
MKGPLYFPPADPASQ